MRRLTIFQDGDELRIVLPGLFVVFGEDGMVSFHALEPREHARVRVRHRERGWDALLDVSDEDA